MQTSILERAGRLYSPILSDTLDSLGLRRHFLGAEVQCLFPDPHLTVAGFAYPARVSKTGEYVQIGNLLRMVDSIPKDAFVVVAGDPGCECALWGGLMSAAAKARGAVAAVVNGPTRDVAQIARLGFTVFCTGRNPHDIRTRGEMVDFNCTVEFNGVTIAPGDLVFGDANGVVVVPKDRILEAIELAEKGVREESVTEAGLDRGGSAVGLFEEFGRF